jgi:hypothetical protein
MGSAAYWWDLPVPRGAGRARHPNSRNVARVAEPSKSADACSPCGVGLAPNARAHIMGSYSQPMKLLQFL